MLVAYQTIDGAVETEIEISRSRFLTRLARVESEEEAREEIAAIKAVHPKARHHCTAFVIGVGGVVRRSNDDGEPSGTAGTPMLETLVAAELSDVVAIVTRYFGGVLLGAGGLTRAYRSAVAEAVAKAKRVRREPRVQISVTSGYEHAPLIEAEARRRGLAVLAVDYAELVTLHLAAAPEEVAGVQDFVAEISAGSVEAVPGSTVYIDL